MKRIFVLLVILAVAGISQASVVADANLRIAVINQLNLDTNYPPIGLGDLTRPDAADMSRPSFTFLDANSLGVSDLTGLDYATNLRTLYLCNNNVTDLSQLSGLTKMRYLRLWQNPNLADLAPLADMNDMLSFRAYDCNIADINVVSKFIKLQYLDLSLNQISDVNALSGLTTLVLLKLTDNNITDINSLENLTGLLYLYLSRNDDISDINALSNMSNLAELGLSDVNLSDISLLADVNQVQYVWLSYNNITDINALTKFTNLNTLSLVSNPMSYQSWCSYLKQIKSNNPTANIYTAPPVTGLMNIDSTDIFDLQIFADWWLYGGAGKECNINNAYCHCADLNETNGSNPADEPDVNFDDFVIFADLWML